MTQNREIEIDVLKILKTWLKKAWIIVLAAAVAGGGLFAYGKATHVPTYTATATMYACYTETVEANYSAANLRTAWSMVDTCRNVINTRAVLDAVIDETGSMLTPDQLYNMISITSNITEVFKLSVTSTDPEEAALLVNTIGRILPGQVAVVNNHSNVGVIDEALVPVVPNGNSIAKDAAVAAVLGALAVCVVLAVQCIVEDVKAAKKENK